jgi:hypothetical protein
MSVLFVFFVGKVSDSYSKELLDSSMILLLLDICCRPKKYPTPIEVEINIRSARKTTRYLGLKKEEKCLRIKKHL